MGSNSVVAKFTLPGFRDFSNFRLFQLFVGGSGLPVTSSKNINRVECLFEDVSCILSGVSSKLVNDYITSQALLKKW